MKSFRFLKRKDIKEDKPRINIPDAVAPKQTFTLSELDQDLQNRVGRIKNEFIQGLGFIRNHQKSVTFFGSARFEEDNEYYKKARSLAEKLGKEGYDIVTGGGPGIMEAANRGVFNCSDCGDSLGFNIELPHEQILNPYVDDNVSFHYFFVRKMILAFSAESYIFFPGGFGTLDEFFEIVTLVQTRKIPNVPIICVGNEYWDTLNTFIKETLHDAHGAISEVDMNLYKITEDEEEIVEIVKNAPLRKE